MVIFEFDCNVNVNAMSIYCLFPVYKTVVAPNHGASSGRFLEYFCSGVLTGISVRATKIIEQIEFYCSHCNQTTHQGGFGIYMDGIEETSHCPPGYYISSFYGTENDTLLTSIGIHCRSQNNTTIDVNPAFGENLGVAFDDDKHSNGLRPIKINARFSKYVDSIQVTYENTQAVVGQNCPRKITFELLNIYNPFINSIVTA